MPRIKYKRPNEFTTYTLAEHIGCSRSRIIYLLQQGIIEEPERKGKKKTKRVWTAKQADEIKRMIESVDAEAEEMNGGNA